VPKLPKTVQYTPRVDITKLPDLEIDDLENVSTSSPATGEVLQYSGGQWANAALDTGDLSDVIVTDTTFTPTLDFQTTGDLSNSYSFQDGLYWTIGKLVFVEIFVSTTPTFSTSSGPMQISLPFTAKTATNPRSILSCQCASTGITWPGSGTQVTGIITGGNDYVRIVAGASGAVVNNITASDCTSGVDISVRLSGFYSVD
jgi:hypothetical protein